MFRITRMRKLVLTDQSFTRRKEDDIEAETDNDFDPMRNSVTLELKFQPEILYRLYDDFDADMINENDDGTYSVSVTFPYDEWVYKYMLSYEHHVEIVKPKFIRDEMAERIKKISDIYD